MISKERVESYRAMRLAIYCRGMRAGRADAEWGRPPRPFGVEDTAYIDGYVDSYNGWLLAMRNTERKRKREEARNGGERVQV